MLSTGSFGTLLRWIATLEPCSQRLHEQRRQQFLCGSGEEFELQPTGEELERKRRMVDEYKSQHHAICDFPLAPERFRPQPTYDYCRPPHRETLNYEAWGWPMNGEQVSAAFGAYMRGGEALSA